MKHGMISVILLGLLSGCATGMGPTTSTDTASIETDADVATIMTQADLAYQQGDLKSAEQAYLQAIKHSPNSAPAQYRLGNTLVRQNRYDDAIKAYKASLAHDANKMQAYNNLAALYIFQAQAILASGVEHLPADAGNTAQIKHMLWQLNKITPDNLQDMGSKAK